MLTTSVLMVLFDPLSHDWDSRYLKPPILPYLGAFRLVQNAGFGYSTIIAKIGVLGTPYPMEKGNIVFFAPS